MSIVLVANTPHSAALIIPAIAELHPDSGPVISVVAHSTAFTFPEKTAYCEFPLVQKVDRGPYLVDHGFAPRRKTTPISIDEVIEGICQTSTVYLFNPEPNGFRSHYHAMLTVRSYNKTAKIRIVEDHPLHPSVTKRAIEAAALIDDFQPVLDAVAIAEHFDFNYQLNSYPLITQLFERAGLRAWRNLSAGALQLLLWLRSRAKGKGGYSFTLKELSVKATLWPGSGQLPLIDGAGRRISLNMTSGCDVVNELMDIGLLVGETERLGLSHEGSAIADEFPSNCRDPDLPFRIEAWKRLPFEEAITHVNSYIMHFFAIHQSLIREPSLGEVFYRKGA